MMKILNILFIYFFLLCVKSIALELVLDPYANINYQQVNVYYPQEIPCYSDYRDFE